MPGCIFITKNIITWQKDRTQNVNYRKIFLMNTDAKSLYEVCANHIFSLSEYWISLQCGGKLTKLHNVHSPLLCSHLKPLLLLQHLTSLSCWGHRPLQTARKHMNPISSVSLPNCVVPADSRGLDLRRQSENIWLVTDLGLCRSTWAPE